MKEWNRLAQHKGKLDVLGNKLAINKRTGTHLTIEQLLAFQQNRISGRGKKTVGQK